MNIFVDIYFVSCRIKESVNNKGWIMYYLYAAETRLNKQPLSKRQVTNSLKRGTVVGFEETYEVFKGDRLECYDVLRYNAAAKALFEELQW